MPGPRVGPAGLRRGYALLVLTALAAACSSSSGSTFPGGGGSSSGSGGGGGGGSSSGGFSVSSLPTCPACSSDGSLGVPDGGSCPEGWMMTASCHCFLPGMLCADPRNDCGGVESVCLPEPTLDGAGNRCHCNCPNPTGASCG